MAKNIKRYYSKIKFFRRKKLTLRFFYVLVITYFRYIIITVCIFLAHKGYIWIVK
ncbi:hypothetical protein J8J04_01090 ['Fragaria x ananassa' phyllody phytoplasma]|uniref:Uncharacterized protein n=1 Tax='Fragaria x ananassa' phyllody phytoplasma TaxID=2358428 RepID=A0ABS5K320_9MOLU|nr:hypothetical protein ['Fragaria x ananassa' phyllody phytoplasma]